MKITNKFLLSLILLISAGFTSNAQTIIEAENATLNGVTINTNAAGYSGTGFVYMAGSGSITVNITVPDAAFYKLVMRVSTTMGNKDQDLYLNGTQISTLKFPANSTFFDFNAGNLPLVSGTNTIEIKKNWGYMYFDKFTFTKAAPHDYSTTAIVPVNANADLKTKSLYTYLRSNYGINIIAGQTSYWNELIAISGKTPVLRAFDMQNYSPHNPWHSDWSAWDDGTVKSAIDWYNSTNGKGIVSFQWHWFSPSGGSLNTSIFYTDKTTFDVSKVLDNNSQEYKDIIRDIDAIAIQLKRLQDAGIPVLWRPLHEAGGAWFWWGAKGPAACLKLYDVMYDRLTNYHHLNNLIWVWSTPEAAWYPGNIKVDILGYDSYPGAYSYGTQKSVFDQLFEITGGIKMITMSENGPIPDIDKCLSEDARWLYFSSWGDLVASQNTSQHIQAVYAHNNVITMDKVQDPSTGLEETINPGFRIYPNPASDVVNIQSDKVFIHPEILVFNSLGQNVLRKMKVSKADPQTISLDVSGLKHGTYFILIKDGTETITDTIIVK